VTYIGDPLAAEMTIAGPIHADLKVSTSGTDCDVVVKVIDLYPDDFRAEGKMAGYMLPVRMDVMRAKFRDSLEVPKPMPANKPTRVAFEMPDVCHTFKKGHRIAIQIQSSWFPLIDRNPGKFCDIYHASPKDFQRTTQKIFCGGNDGSKISVRVLPQ
jgi:predicted acyl esterase